jgi:hypothetical protein
MTKEIKFNPVDKLSEHTVPSPKSAIEYLPEWYKKATPFFSKKPEFDMAIGKPNATFKHCMPFLDSFSMGYIQETWCDIWIEKKDDETLFYYAAGPTLMSERAPRVGDTFPKVDGFLKSHYTWHPPWFPELPIGYSCLITHPINHTNLPFQTFTGVVDADGFTQSESGSNLPFLLKEGFSGMIKKGTPMYQIIPFKRESWQSVPMEYNEEHQLSVTQSVKQYMWGGYKNLFWKKKEFK